jgi:hypothetical protein
MSLLANDAEQLPTRERELDSKDGVIAMWEDGLVAFECALGRACTERDAFMASSRRSFNFDQNLEEHRILLSLKETDLEKREENLTEEQANSLHSYNGHDLSIGLEELRARMAGVEDERAAKVVGLS